MAKMTITRASVLFCGTLLGFISASTAQSVPFTVDTPEAISKSAKIIANDLVALYESNKNPDAPGRLNQDYNYWQGGALMATLIDYWHKTKDSTHNDLVTEGILFQASNDTFQPANLRPSYLGNEDQCFWGLAAMLAAEDNFPKPASNEKTWVDIAKSVYDLQRARLDEEIKWCNGGLRWGIDASHHGWGSKNARDNGCLFNLAARLARYTGDKKYAETATELYDWLADHLIDENGRVFQGTLTKDDCKSGINKLALYYSIDSVLVAHGAAFMYNHTDGNTEWRTRVEKLTFSIRKDFFPGKLAFEPDCEGKKLCNSDEIAFKSVNFRSLAVVPQLAPFTSDTFKEVLQDSAKAIALGCTNQPTGRRYQFYWLDLDPSLIFPDDEPSTTGVGEAMNALSAFSSLFIKQTAPPAVAPPPSTPPENDDSDGGSGDGGSGDAGDGSSSSQGGSGSGDSKGGDKSATPRMLDMPSLLFLGLGLILSSWVGSQP